MPSKDTVRDDKPDTYYHVYNRGLNQMKLFRDDSDYRYFEEILARSLSFKKVFDKFSRQYANFCGEVDLLAYSLLPNEFNLLVHQNEIGQLNKFMTTLQTAYTLYYNHKYHRRGTIYESRFKAFSVNKESLNDVSRAVHIKPMHFDYRTWDHSSYSDYLYNTRDWIDADVVLNKFDTRADYSDFVDDYTIE
jgi:hypothetical protein